MRIIVLTCVLTLLVPLAASAQETRVYRWVDADGLVHYGDTIPARFAEFPKDVLNDHGVTIQNLAGKKTAEQLEADERAAERRVAQKLQQRADQALLATYITVEEILLHRDRRIELFQAQSRVTELYLSNLTLRLDDLRGEASGFQPYSDDPDAPIIDADLAADLRSTKETIARHERNLEKFLADEQRIITRFDGDISRFKVLKGID
ncbi:MAG: DUF4124 domain-containing protein [Proteobacteria bacterium]|nr:DUF4124 domain-containing protein [Pseudomonadota bacterium]